MSGSTQPMIREAPGAASTPAAGPSLSTPQRSAAYGARYAVASDSPVASFVGMTVLESGGNAVDAAIAVSAVCVATMPIRTHLGGDAFCLIWDRGTGAVECLNAGGRAPRLATLDQFPDGIPQRGARASTVPGLVDAWVELHERHGSMSLADVLAPPVELAREGFAVSPHLAGGTRMLEALSPGETNDAIKQAFLVGGATPYRPGQVLRQPALAETLERIARDDRDGFYGGQTGRAIASAMAEAGGLITADDLAAPAAHWEEPLSISFGGCTIYEQALPSQGVILLEALNIVEACPPIDWGVAGPDAIHVMVEALKLAFADARRLAADPKAVPVDLETLLSKAHARALAAQIDLEHAAELAPAGVEADTTSFVVADEDTAVAFIQSVYWPWGSGFLIPDTGVLMNNRMSCFDTVPGHPNCLAPEKRALHTLNNFLAVREGRLVAGGGTPGADNQVQVNLQVLVGMLEGGLDLQAAIDAPHFVMRANGALALEGRVPGDTIQALERRGHRVERLAAWDTRLSRSQLVASLPAAGWAAASDLRGEGVALAR